MDKRELLVGKSDDVTFVMANAIRLLRKLSPDMPIQQADILLCVVSKPGLTMNELSKLTGLSQSSISRNVQAMSKYHRLGKPGLNLMEAVIDPREPRRRLVFLTAEGKAFITKLMRTINPDYSIDKETDARLEIERMHEEAAAAASEAPKTTRGKTSPV
jgi:DNA-binding MarR family transcriptional regulator